MKSPFPGMDPYIEGCGLWEDFSHSLICDVARQLGEVLPERYVARIGVREYTTICYSDDECLYPTPPVVGGSAKPRPILPRLAGALPPAAAENPHPAREAPPRHSLAAAIAGRSHLRTSGTPRPPCQNLPRRRLLNLPFGGSARP